MLLIMDTEQKTPHPMRDEDRETFDKVWRYLVHRTRRMPTLHGLDPKGRQEDNAEARQAYWDLLRELPLEAIKRSARELGRECTTMPTAATWFGAADSIAAGMIPNTDPAPDPEEGRLLPGPAAERKAGRAKLVATLRGRHIRERELADIRGVPMKIDWSTIADKFELLMQLQGDRQPRPPYCEACQDVGWQQHTCSPVDPCGRVDCGDVESDPHPYVTRCTCFESNPAIARRRRQQNVTRERRAR